MVTLIELDKATLSAAQYAGATHYDLHAEKCVRHLYGNVLKYFVLPLECSLGTRLSRKASNR
jgi:hypothetical protein